MKLFKSKPKEVKLPTGVTEFNQWAEKIISMTDLPDNDSMRFALASSILGLKATEGHVPLEYFAGVLTKAASSQVAVQIMQDLKDKQAREAQEAKEAAEKAAQQEATPTPEDASNAAQTQG